MTEINYQSLAMAMQNSQREVVDGSLGQVPVTPTIGRLGAYNVVVRATPRENSMTSLATALAQAPQLLGQFRNISEKQGQLDAEELSIEEVAERFKNQDTEAEGFFTMLGKQKAFSETMYRRFYDTDITNGFKDVSHEFDTMHIEQLKALGSGQTLEANARQRYAASIPDNVLDTITGDPFMEAMHNRAVGDTIVKLSKEAVLAADSRVQAYTKKETGTNITEQVLRGLDDLQKLEQGSTATEEGSDEFSLLTVAGVSFDGGDSEPISGTGMLQPISRTGMLPPLDPEESEEMLADTQTSLLQETINRVTESSSGILTNTEIEGTTIKAIGLGVEQALADGDYMTTRALYDKMESGELKINGRPIEYTASGAALMVRTKKQLEQAEEESKNPYTKEHKSIVNSKVVDLTQSFLKANENGATDEQKDAFTKAIAETINYTGENPDGLPTEGINELQAVATLMQSRSKGEHFETEITNEKRTELGNEFLAQYRLNSPEKVAQAVSLSMLARLKADDPSLSPFLDLFTKPTENRDGIDIPSLTNVGAAKLKETYDRAVRKTVYQLTDGRNREELPLNVGDSTNPENFEPIEAQVVANFLADLQRQKEQADKRNPPPAPTPQVVKDVEGRSPEEIASTIVTEGGVLDKDGKLQGVGVRTAQYNGLTAGYVSPSSVVTVYNHNGLVEVIKDPAKREVMNNANSPEEVARVLTVSVNRAHLNEENKAERVSFVTNATNSQKRLEAKRTYVKRSEVTGLPLSLLLKDGGVETARVTTRDGWFSNDYGDRTINYDIDESLSGKGQSTKRIYNIQALVEANKGNTKTLNEIYNVWQAKTGITYDEFFKNQSTLYEATIAPLPTP